MTLAQINAMAKANIEKVAGIKLSTCTACEDGFSIDFEINADAIARLRKAFKVIDYVEDELGFAYCGIVF